MPVQSDATQQLSAIPFGTLIGGPLNAAVQAQAQAAKTSIEFIQTVGFNSNGEARNVVFIYEKDGKIVKLVVPILSIVPIPYIRVDELTIAFKASISAETNEGGTDMSSTSYGGGTTGSARIGWGFWGAKADFNASYSSKKDSTATRDSRYSVEYTMDIHCRAVQDSVPAGLSSVLSLLRESIAPKPIEGTLEIAITNDKIVQGSTATVTVTAKDNSQTPAAVGDVFITLSCENQLITFNNSRVKTEATGTATFTMNCKAVPTADPAIAWKTDELITNVDIRAIATNFAGTHTVKIVGA